MIDSELPLLTIPITTARPAVQSTRFISRYDFLHPSISSASADKRYSLGITVNPYILGAIGLVLDMVGACFVAYEVVLQYRGQKYRDMSTIDSINDQPIELPEYTAWEGRKYKFMLTGLVILFFGCAVQLLGLWLGYRASVETPSQVSPIAKPEQRINPASTHRGTKP